MPVFDDNDFVGVGYRAHPVGYDENGLVFNQFRQTRLYFCFVLHVQGCCRFIGLPESRNQPGYGRLATS